MTVNMHAHRVVLIQVSTAPKATKMAICLVLGHFSNNLCLPNCLVQMFSTLMMLTSLLKNITHHYKTVEVQYEKVVYKNVVVWLVHEYCIDNIYIKHIKCTSLVNFSFFFFFQLTKYILLKFHSL